MSDKLEMRTSERRDLRSCVQKWYWSQVEGLAPNRPANALWFGTAVHEGLAGWYLDGTKRGPHPSETFLAHLDGERSMIVNDEEGERAYVDARTLGVDMLNRYVEHYGKDERYSFLATERAFRVNISRPEMLMFGKNLPALKRWMTYVGIWDGVYRDLETNEVWIIEHKTAASIRYDHLPLDDQAGTYPAVATPVLRRAGILGPDEEIAGIHYNFLRKALGDERPVNEDGLRTNKPNKQQYLDALSPYYELTGKEKVDDLEDLVIDVNRERGEGSLIVLGDPSATQPAPYFERFPVYRSRAEQRRMIQRVKIEGVYNEAYRNGDLPITKNPDRDKCNFCQFKVMCQMDETGDQLGVEDMKEALYHVRDPYEDHVVKSA
jgi:hypothetical protein